MDAVQEMYSQQRNILYSIMSSLEALPEGRDAQLQTVVEVLEKVRSLLEEATGHAVTPSRLHVVLAGRVALPKAMALSASQSDHLVVYGKKLIVSIQQLNRWGEQKAKWLHQQSLVWTEVTQQIDQLIEQVVRPLVMPDRYSSSRSGTPLSKSRSSSAPLPPIPCQWNFSAQDCQRARFSEGIQPAQPRATVEKGRSVCLSRVAWVITIGVVSVVVCGLFRR